MWEKHQLYESEVLAHFGEYTTNVDVTDKTKNEVEKVLKAQVGLLFSKVYGRRPPRVCLVGPSGSGRSTQASCL